MNCLKQGFLALASLVLSMALIIGFLYVYIAAHLPDTKQLKHVQYQLPLTIYDAHGHRLGTYGAIDRQPVALSAVPSLLQLSFIAAEDHRFYQHFGVDFVGLARAIKVLVSTGHKSQGASTITMQVARNFFLTRDKTFKRKFKENLLALKIDQELTKDNILNLYLNKIYLGQGAYGVAAGARVYYGKSLRELTLPQMAMMAGLPQAPSTDNPIRHPAAAKARRNYVLKRLWEIQAISESSYRSAIQAPVTAAYHSRPDDFKAPYATEAVRRILVEALGREVYRSGIKVYTTIDSSLQQEAKEALVNGLLAYTKRHGYTGPVTQWGDNEGFPWLNWQKRLRTIDNVYDNKPGVIVDVDEHQAQALLASGGIITLPWSSVSTLKPQSQWGWPGPAPESVHEVLQLGDVIYLRHQQQWQIVQLPKVQGSFIAMNPHDGAIKALVGGFSFKQSHYIRPLQALRQSGSSFKPFLYAAALNRGYTLASVLNDAPVVMGKGNNGELWRPENANDQFHGPTRLRTALIHSRNLISIRLLQKLGINPTRAFIHRFGFELDHLPRSLSLALGSGVSSSMQLTRGYSAFANGGRQVTPHLIAHIDNQLGERIYENHSSTAYFDEQGKVYGSAQPIISQANAYLINNTLHNVITQGTAHRAMSLKRADIAGKTGTTNDLKDAWFAGYHPDLAATAWVGFDEPKSLHEYGAQAALPIWIHFMAQALPTLPQKPMPRPNNIITARIDPETGQLADPSQKQTLFELFRRSHLPKKINAKRQTQSDQAIDYLF